MQKGEWRDPALGQVTFRSWAEQWLTANPAKRATSLARDRVVLKTHFLPQLGDRTLGAITRAHVKGCVDAMTAKLAPTTVRTNLGVLNAVLNAAVDADLIARSPARGIRVPAGPHRERPTLTLEELDRLAAAVPAEYRALILVAGLLGLRWSGCIGLRLGDVDFLRRTLTVRQTHTYQKPRTETWQLILTCAGRRLQPARIGHVAGTTPAGLALPTRKAPGQIGWR